MAVARVVGLVLGAALGAGACAREATPPGPAAVTREQFTALRWLEGRWRGIEAGGAPFHESYRFTSDSVLESVTFADSTFKTPTDSGRVYLRGDTLFSGWPTARWIAVALDSAHVSFAPLTDATNAFTWRRAGAIVWLAELTWTENGVARRRVYEMHRAP